MPLTHGADAAAEAVGEDKTLASTEPPGSVYPDPMVASDNGDSESVRSNVLIEQFPLFHGKAPVGHPYPQAFTEGATVQDEARVDAEHIFREVYSACLSGNALEQRVQERLRVWDADHHKGE